METVKKQAEQITVLEETLSKTQTQKQMYAEAMENLQTDNDTLEQEIVQLKKNAAKKEEKRLSVPKSNSSLDHEESSELSLETDNINLYELNQQMESLKSAIRYLRAENTHLKGSDLVRSLDLTAGKTTSDNVQKKELLKSFAMETRILVKDMRMASAAPKLIQLTTERKGGKWQSDKKLPDYQYQTQQSVLYTLKQRCDQLKERMSQQKIQEQTLYTKVSHTTNKEIRIANGAL